MNLDIGYILNPLKKLLLAGVIFLTIYAIFRISLFSFLTGDIYGAIEAKHYDRDIEMAIKYLIVIPVATVVVYSVNIQNTKKSIIIISIYLGCCYLAAYTLRKGLPALPTMSSPSTTRIYSSPSVVTPTPGTPNRSTPEPAHTRQYNSGKNSSAEQACDPVRGFSVYRAPDGVCHYVHDN